MYLTTLTTVQEYLRETSGDATQEALITTLVDGVEALVSRYTGLALAATEYTEYHPGGYQYLPLGWGPVASVSSVHRMESDEAIAATYYTIIDSRALLYQYAQRWVPGTFRVVYTAGPYSDDGGLESVVLQLVARAWEQRGEVASESSGAGGQGLARLLGGDWEVLLLPYMYRTGLG